jgi:hypothetical protein
MKFFTPDWDDRVDPNFDFLTDRFTLQRDPYRDDLYAHELMNVRVYDGILLSRSAIGESGPKRALLEQLGARAYLRLPRDMELLGDCGAFGYVRDREPRYETDDVIAYYDRLGFDYGVSVDHLIVPEFQSERACRYELTLRNAQLFLDLWRRGRYRFAPIGAVQGWDVTSYVEAARATVAMGYDYIAVGGLARSNTRQVQEIVAAVVAAVPAGTRLHLFGVARATLHRFFLEVGVTSVDSAAPLRQAWLSAQDNYYAPNRTYAAIRIPVADEERARARDTILARSPLGDGGLATLRAAERAALRAVRDHAVGRERLGTTLEAVMAYDQLLGERLDGQKPHRRQQLYHETLQDRPWKNCGCAICRDLGVEVIIFRGNNRNRRRGFHNLYTFYRRLQELESSNKAGDYSAQLPLQLTPPIP